jgi:superkiller protein 3
METPRAQSLCWNMQYPCLQIWYGLSITNTLSIVDNLQPIPNLEFAYRTFNSLQQKLSNDQSDLVISAFFSLERCLLRRPNDVAALHLAALVSERLTLLERAATFARRSSALLETAYERSEDSQIARQYAITQSTLGRILLTDGDFAGAAVSYEIVLSLVDRPNDLSEIDADSLKIRLQAHTASGLAALLSGDAEAAISSFEAGLEEAPMDMKAIRSQLTILLAQTMWVLGTNEAREMARSMLLER